MPLTDLAIRNLKPDKKPKKVSDGDGLYLFITPSGSKLWRFDFTYAGKRQTLSLGKWPKDSLAQARAALLECKKSLDAGRDPRKPQADVDFKSVAERWFTRESVAWGTENTKRIRRLLDHDLYPHIGHIGINEIEPPQLLDALRKMEDRGLGESVHRLRGYIGRIFRFGIAEGICSRDMAADIRDGLRRRPRVDHRAKLSASDLPGFLSKLDTCAINPTTRDALEFTLLCAARTAETRYAHVDEFLDMEGDEPLWRLSPKRMKMEREHLVPLSRQAADIARRRISEARSNGFLFHGGSRGGGMSENTMLYAVYRMGYHSRATVHGLRGTFSTIANDSENPEWNGDWIEMALAHVESGVRSAYNSARYLNQRRKLLQWWADYLDGHRSKSVP